MSLFHIRACSRRRFATFTDISHDVSQKVLRVRYSYQSVFSLPMSPNALKVQPRSGNSEFVYAAVKGWKERLHFRGKRARWSGYSRACVNYRIRETCKMASSKISRLKGSCAGSQDSDEGGFFPPTFLLNDIPQPSLASDPQITPFWRTFHFS